MNRSVFIFIFLFVDGFTPYAQFIKQGSVIFQKRININAILQKRFGDKMDQFSIDAVNYYKSHFPQFREIEYELKFDSTQSLFQRITPLLEEEKIATGRVLGNDNTVYNNFASNISISKKNVLGDIFLLRDSICHVVWKIVSEWRDIAGFQCRRANGLLMDSIYVVAYFSNKILSTCGPEFITGLPGAILGLAIPSQHITWFATKIVAGRQSPLVPPEGGVQVSRNELYNKLKNSLDKTDLIQVLF